MYRRMSGSERQFSKFLESKGKTWAYEPCKLDIGVPCEKVNRYKTYTPDFWCPEDNCYYEVSATRQAYSQSMKKIPLAMKQNPGLVIKVVKPNGSEYNNNYHLIDYKKRQNVETKHKGAIRESMTSKQKIIEIRKLLSPEQMARILDVSIATVKSWTKSQKGARAPGKENAGKIDELYNVLGPCFERIKNLK